MAIGKNPLLRGCVALVVTILAGILACAPAAAVAPVAQSAVLRIQHGAAGSFDLPLSLTTTNPTIEPRQSSTATLVMTFDKPITGADVAVIEGAATAGAPTFNGNNVSIGLTGFGNLQHVTIALTNVTSADGGTGGSRSVRIGFLLGDVNQSRVVSVADLGLVNAQLSQAVTATNFLKDVNVSGTLTLADKGVTNTKLTQALVLPANPANQAPAVTAGAVATTITLPAGASLTGSISDDGLPNPPAAVTTTWSKVSGPGTVTFGNAAAVSTTADFSVAGTYVLRLSAFDGQLTNTAAVTITVNASSALPPDPSTIAPPIDPTIAPNLADTTVFLYTGPTPIQTGVAPGTINPLRAAVVRGRVLDRVGAPISGVQMSVLGHPEYGQTLTRLDGRFDMAVNGGGLLTLNYVKTGYLPVQRQATVPWQDYRVIDDVVMIPLDAAVTAIDLSAAAPIQVARGGGVTDKDGTRRATMFFAQGTTATIGGMPVTSLSIRATEYTVGPTGPKAMPGQLPPASGYTYAVELSADEAQGQQVQFSKPVVTYVENFLNFPVGGLVPAGYYDRARAAWVASNNGKVIKILSITAGKADLDTDGDGLIDSPATLAALGITDAERQALATLYTVGLSLWRVPITHFTPWDINWPFGPPPGASGPGGPPHGPLPKPKKPGTPPDKDCLGSGSVIYCQSQALGEVLPVVGTPWQLHYLSDRMPGTIAGRTLAIPLSAATLPASLSRIDLEIAVAGQHVALQFPPTPGQTYVFTWDGKDIYGRAVPGGAVTATVRIGYTYSLVRYQDPASFEQSFGAVSGIPMSNDSSRTEITLWRESTETITGNLPPAWTVGGWSLSPHHTYDPGAKVLYQGDGTRRDGEATGAAIKTGAGIGSSGFSGDGGQAALAEISQPYGVAVGPDGSVYIADTGNNRIRRIGPDGVITTVAGAGYGFGGDGGPATSALLREPGGVAVGADGSLYIGDTYNARIRRVGTNGIITTVAGSGTVTGVSGDGGPATLAELQFADRIAVGADGSLYLIDEHRIRRVDPNGIINTIAGNGTPGFSGDGGPASLARLNFPRDVAVGPDGSIYIVDAYNYRVRRIGTDGIITTVAGNGVNPGASDGDGGPATAAKMNPWRVHVAPDGGIFIAESYTPRIRYVGTGGIITTLAGTGIQGYGGDGGLATRATFGSPVDVALAPDGSLWMTDRPNHRVRRIAAVSPGVSVSDITIASEDGAELYVFSGGGRHLRTRDTLTGSIRYQFGYDVTGRLITITDGSGNVTTIARDGNGNPTSIVAPGGQQTTLTVDANGYLAAVANPANEVVHLSSSSQGLLLSLTDAKGGVYNFTYDPVGLLIKDQDPAGGVKTLSRAEDPTGHTVTLTTALGRVSTYQVEHLATGAVRRTNSDANGAHTIVVTNPDGTQTITQPDGQVITSTLGPDPRFGMQSPLVVNRVRTLPSLTETTTATRSVTLSNPDDPLSLLTLNETATINGRTFTRDYVAATRTLTSTSAVGRQVVSVLDAKGRAVQQTPPPGIMPVTPFTVTYDALGRVTENRQGAWFLTYGYDARNRVTTTTDAAGRQTVLGYDNADRVIQKTQPGGAVYQFAYDANGNRTQVVLPSGAPHLLGFTAVDLDASYTPPGNGSYLRVHDVDRALTSMTLPGGRVTSVGHDAAGRVNGISYVEAATAVDYFAADATDRAAHVNHVPTAGPAQNLAFSYNGGLITGMTATGAAPASVAYTFGNDFVVTNMNLTSGVDTVTAALTRDQDGILTGYGPFTLTRTGPGGALSAISDGTPNTSTAYGYDALGRKSARSHKVNNLDVYALQLSFDVTGRIAGKSETIGGTVYTQAYTYDVDGQLTNVTRNGAAAEHYTYDANGNRTSRQLNAGPVETAIYDAQDRLTQRGLVAYVFNADGFLTQRGADTFQYNTRGQLIQATVGAQPISYAYDGIGRRVSRTDTGGTTRYLYGDPASHLVTAVRDTAGALTKLYYDTAGMLIALERGGARYHVAVDQVGTPRVVSDSTGVVVKVTDADSFGNSIADSNPAFVLPIGYAGGLADPGTGLVHFGLRDYDTASGRWTGRDPVLFAGGQGNLYLYVGNSPLGNRDPLGLFCISVSVYEGLGGGVQSCFSLEGASVCGEAGAGLGSSVALDSGKIEDNGINLIGEITVATPFAKLGVEGSLDPLTGCVKAVPKGQILKGTLDAKGKTGIDLLPSTPGVEGKFGVKVCVAQKF